MEQAVGLTPDPIDTASVVALVGGAAGSSGAVVTFLGAVRDQNAGRRVLSLEYEAYDPLAVRALELIVRESAERWPGVRVAMRHRVGRLVPGETSIVIAAASRHRSEAFAACRYAIERVKQIVPIWKREFFEGGDCWVEGAVADPADERARQEAYRRACV